MPGVKIDLADYAEGSARFAAERAERAKKA
jgi:hypothetical protein